jgi:hypothetical protein
LGERRTLQPFRIRAGDALSIESQVCVDDGGRFCLRTAYSTLDVMAVSGQLLTHIADGETIATIIISSSMKATSLFMLIRCAGIDALFAYGNLRDLARDRASPREPQ